MSFIGSQTSFTAGSFSEWFGDSMEPMLAYFYIQDAGGERATDDSQEVLCEAVWALIREILEPAGMWMLGDGEIQGWIEPRSEEMARYRDKTDFGAVFDDRYEPLIEALLDDVVWEPIPSDGEDD